MINLRRFTFLVPCMVLCTAVAMAQFTPPASQVELDGNPGPTYASPPPPANPLNTCTYLINGVVTPNQPCDYWNSINGFGLDPAFPYTATKPYNHYGVNTFVTGGAGTESFTGGGSKDPNNIPQWKWSAGPTPDKDTLTNGYAAAYIGPSDGHTILTFGMDRFSTSGDANIGAWFFQQSVAPISGGSFAGTHVNGDVFLISAFTNGGGTSTITVYLWDSTGIPGVGPVSGCTASNYSTPSTLPACAATNLLEVYSASANSVCGNNPTCAITNAGSVNVTWNYQAKSNSGTGVNTIPGGAFFTGGVDLTYIFKTLLNLPVPCLSSFLYDTRSSQSPSAVLKDFIGGNFQLCSISANASCSSTPTYTIGPSPTFTPTIHYTINGSVKNEASGNLFGLTVATTVVPANASNVQLTQPVTPAGGLAFNNTASFTVKFDYPNLGSISVSGNACGAAFPGGPCTVVNKPDGTPATWTATEGDSATTCSLQPTTSMTMEKSCVINLVPGSNGVVLQLQDTVKVCNTDANDPILNINIANTVQNVAGGAQTLTPKGGLSLAPNTCQTYTPAYTPTNCVNSVLNGANADPGRCKFTDTVDFIAPLPTDEFGNAVTPLPPAADAECHVCVAGQCTPSGTP